MGRQYKCECGGLLKKHQPVLYTKYYICTKCGMMHRLSEKIIYK